MKTKQIYLTLIAALTLSSVNAQKELPAGVDKNWYAQTIASLDKMKYAFTGAKDNKSFSVTNPVNNLSFTITEKGYTVTGVQKNAPTIKWNASFLLKGFGRNNIYNVAGANFAIVKKEAALTYQSPAMNVQYINSEEGLRQNFIIKEKPAGNGNLQIGLAIQSSLTALTLSNNRIALHTKGNIKDIQMVYDGLKVWDAKMNSVKATMQVDPSTNIITISAEDENAVYPLTVDPLNRTPEWSTSADGVLTDLINLQLQVQTTYGYTVAGLGDINGDGYDDVAVSAPTMADVWSGTGSLTGVGAVFIYLGSPTGLKNTPDKILQPTTALNGALFGYSVDAGDITGDGKNDIVIGAPLDTYQTTASSLLGNTNVNVKAGKVYVYRSEDLFTAPNPSPFLQIKLQGDNYFHKGLTAALGNTTLNPLFGFSVAVTKDLNGDNKADILIGAPAFVGVDILSVQNGAAFIYYSNNLATPTPAQLNPPSMSLLGITGLLPINTEGLLFGYSIDGAGDFNKDGFPDVVVGAPAGVDLSSLGGLFSGQVLGGSAYVFYGTGSSVNTTTTVKLQASPSGLLSNAANLFGFKVKGVENAFGIKTGNILVGAPNGDVISNLGTLKVKAGEVLLFKQKTPGASGTFTSDQSLSSPRSSSILSVLAGTTTNVSLLYGASIDNMLDVNCDNIGDIIIGEPLSTAVPLLGVDALGGAAYVYLGKADGTYNSTPIWDLYTDVSSGLGVNATSLLGYSVAGAGHTKGASGGVRSLVGGPTNALDFGVGLLNLNNTIATTLDFAIDNNGLGKSYSFAFTNCNITLPVSLISFKAQALNNTVPVNWVAITETDFSHYELERSIDGMHFETIAIVFAKNQQRNDYAYTDKHPYTGVNYYRLKLVDNDKKFTYSSVAAVRFDENITADVLVAPNPVAQDINIKMTGLAKGVYKAEVMNAAGQIFITKSLQVTQFSQTETLERKSAMSAGIYWLNIYDNTNRKITSIRILVQ